MKRVAINMAIRRFVFLGVAFMTHMKRIVITLLVICICYGFCSCMNSDTTTYIKRRDGLFGYRSLFYDIPQIEGYKIQRSNVFLDEENYCISSLYCRDTDQLLKSKVYTVSPDGELINTLEFDGDVVFDGKIGEDFGWFSYNDNAAYAFNRKGEARKRIEPSFQAYGCYFTDVGIWFYSTTEIEFFPSGKSSGIKINIDIIRVDGEQPIIESNGNYYIVEDVDPTTRYYEVDINTGTTKYMCSSEECGVISYITYGRYIIESKKVFALDVENKTLYQIADMNDIDIRPPIKSQYMGEYMKFVNDDLFYKFYSYTDGTGEVQVYSYDSSIDNRSKTILTIGGYGLSYDIPLNMAVYNYNTSHDAFRIITVDYVETLPINDRSLYQQSLLNLMKDFENGNAPDMFYGVEFDYEYMGRNDMVLDLLGEGFSLELENISEPIKKLIIDNEGHCYRAFPSYTINGYWGLDAKFDYKESYSINDLKVLAEENSMRLFNNVYTENLADSIIRYPLKNLWGINGAKKTITQEKMEAIISFCIDNSNPMGNQSQIAMLDFNECLAYELQVGSLEYIRYFENEYKSKITYIGYPSVDGSVHIASPNGLVAVSASTSEKEECSVFLNILFDEEIQKTAAINGEIPVNDAILFDMITNLQNPTACTDPIWKSMCFNNKAISADTVNSFLQAINSVDTLAFYDWGISNIIYDEVELHYSQGRTIEETSKILMNRIDLYVDENY